MIDEQIVIDKHNLDEECSEAPAFFNYWLDQELDHKTKKENREAELSSKLRRMPEDELIEEFGLKKLTEGAINAFISTDKSFSIHKTKQVEAEVERRSYEKKIALIESIVKLHGQGYFAKVEGRPSMRAEIVKKARKAIREQIKASSSKKLEKPEKPSRPNR